ncbi:TPA: hypothetical protein ACFRHE_002077 [Neisseria lactamica]|uniref:hypothetical protein n=2 Tax=Neisseria lactamica TaxID=486 RepID=UPI00128FD902|nr:hypothetical protein [Neisseria lactamica]
MPSEALFGRHCLPPCPASQNATGQTIAASTPLHKVRTQNIPDTDNTDSFPKTAGKKITA